MGRQIEFLMDPADEEVFIGYARGTGDVMVVPHRLKDLKHLGISDLPDPVTENFNYALHLFNRSISDRLITRYVEEQNCYMVDDSVSSIVEFSRTIREGKTIRPGRLYAEFKYVDSEGKWAPKEPEFQKWYETLARWIRKNYSRDIDPHYYFGPGALKLVKSREVEVSYQ